MIHGEGNEGAKERQTRLISPGKIENLSEYKSFNNKKKTHSSISFVWQIIMNSWVSWSTKLNPWNDWSSWPLLWRQCRFNLYHIVLFLIQTLLAAFSCLVASAVAFPYPYPMPMPVAFPDDSYHKPHHDSYGHDIGRVKIQVRANFLHHSVSSTTLLLHFRVIKKWKYHT